MLKVKELSEERGWNISRLSEESGVSYPQTLTLWHNRARRFDRHTLQRVADALGVPVWMLFYEEPRLSVLQMRILQRVKVLVPDAFEQHQIDMVFLIEEYLYTHMLNRVVAERLRHYYGTVHCEADQNDEPFAE